MIVKLFVPHKSLAKGVIIIGMYYMLISAGLMIIVVLSMTLAAIIAVIVFRTLVYTTPFPQVSSSANLIAVTYNVQQVSRQCNDSK